jgi:hypothetical protein
MEAHRHHAEGVGGEETGSLLRRPPGHDLSLDQQSTHFNENHTGPHRQYAWVSANGNGRIHAGDSYVEQQHNYYGSEPAPRNPSSKSIRLQTALAFPEMNLRSANIATAQTQTCEWIFETPEYKRWLDPACRPAHHGILWIKGKPGAGKSTIMKHILSQIKRDTGKSISFFFNARGQELARSTEGLYRALLHPIVESVPSLQDMVDMSDRQLYKDQGWPLPVLKDLFREAVRHCRYEGTLTCCIDALDECNEDAVRDMLALFEDLGEMATSEELPFSVCFTSRHYPSITIARVEELSIDNLRGHRKDISEYVDRRLKLNHVGAKLKEELVAEIQKRSSGVFLWVVLVVGILNKTGDRGNVHLLRNRLWELPTTLRELFDNIIEREKPGANILPIMQWMLYSGRPLTAAELYFAVMASTDSLSEMTIRCDAEVVNERVLRDFITTSSKGFLEVVAVNVGHYEITSPGLSVQFIHESVREFFLAYGLQRIDRSLGTLGNSVAQDSHQQLARCCLTYMQLILSQHLSSIGSRKSPSFNSLISEDSLDSAPFLAYTLFYGACYHFHNGMNELPCNHIADDFSGLGSIMAGTYDHLGSKHYAIGLHTSAMHDWMDRAHRHLLQHVPETPDLAHVSRGNSVRLQSTWELDALHVARCKIICVLLAKADNITSSCEYRSADFASHSGCGHAVPLLLLINYGPKAYFWTMKAHNAIQQLVIAMSMKDEPAVYVWIAAMADRGMLTGSLKEDICKLLHIDL